MGRVNINKINFDEVGGFKKIKKTRKKLDREDSASNRRK